MLLSDIDVADQVIWGQFGSGSAPDFMGFVFGYQDRGHFYLFDWKKTEASFLSFGTAPMGMRLRAFHVPAGEDPDGRDFWAAGEPANVTVLAENDLAWANRVDYDFSLRFTPGSFVIRIWEGDVVLETWEVTDSTYLSGRFGYFINSLQAVRFGQVLVHPLAPVRITEFEHFANDQILLRWTGGEPPFRVQRNETLATPWTEDPPNLWERSVITTSALGKEFFRIHSVGESLTNPPSL